MYKYTSHHIEWNDSINVMYKICLVMVSLVLLMICSVMWTPCIYALGQSRGPCEDLAFDHSEQHSFIEKMKCTL